MEILKNVGFYPDEVLLVLQNNVSFLIVLEVSSITKEVKYLSEFDAG